MKLSLITSVVVLYTVSGLFVPSSGAKPTVLNLDPSVRTTLVLPGSGIRKTIEEQRSGGKLLTLRGYAASEQVPNAVILDNGEGNGLHAVGSVITYLYQLKKENEVQKLPKLIKPLFKVHIFVTRKSTVNELKERYWRDIQDSTTKTDADKIDDQELVDVTPDDVLSYVESDKAVSLERKPTLEKKVAFIRNKRDKALVVEKQHTAILKFFKEAFPETVIFDENGKNAADIELAVQLFKGLAATSSIVVEGLGAAGTLTSVIDESMHNSLEILRHLTDNGVLYVPVDAPCFEKSDDAGQKLLPKAKPDYILTVNARNDDMDDEQAFGIGIPTEVEPKLNAVSMEKRKPLPLLEFYVVAFHTNPGSNPDFSRAYDSEEEYKKAVMKTTSGTVHRFINGIQQGTFIIAF